MADPAVYLCHWIAAVLRHELRLGGRMTLHAESLRIHFQQTGEVAAVHFMTGCAALLERLVLVRLRKLVCIMASHAQIGHGAFEQRFTRAFVRIMASRAIALARGFVQYRFGKPERLRVVAACAQFRAGALQSQHADLAVRFVAGETLPFVGRSMRELSLEVRSLVAFEALALLAETRSLFNLRPRRILRDEEHSSKQYEQECHARTTL